MSAKTIKGEILLITLSKLGLVCLAIGAIVVVLLTVEFGNVGVGLGLRIGSSGDGAIEGVRTCGILDCAKGTWSVVEKTWWLVNVGLSLSIRDDDS